MAPKARGQLAFEPQLLGMTGGHRFSPCPQPVLGGYLQAELRKLEEGSHHLCWAQGGLGIKGPGKGTGV